MNATEKMAMEVSFAKAKAELARLSRIRDREVVRKASCSLCKAPAKHRCAKMFFPYGTPRSPHAERRRAAEALSVRKH